MISCTKCWATARASPIASEQYCDADCTSPREPGYHSPASVVVPLSTRVCQLPGYHIDQPHSWHARGGWVPSPVFCKIQPRSTDDSVFWGVPEEIRAVVCHTHRDWIWGRWRKVPACASWLTSTPLLACPSPRRVLRGIISAGSLPGHLWNVGSGPINWNVRWGLSAQRQAENVSQLYEALRRVGEPKQLHRPWNILTLLLIILITVQHAQGAEPVWQSTSRTVFYETPWLINPLQQWSLIH